MIPLYREGYCKCWPGLCPACTARVAAIDRHAGPAETADQIRARVDAAWAALDAAYTAPITADRELRDAQIAYDAAEAELQRADDAARPHDIKTSPPAPGEG